MFTFLHQTDKFIITGDMAAQTFWQWSDDIKPEDDITPFDGIYYTSGFWPRVRARALRAPVFLGSFICQTAPPLWPPPGHRSFAAPPKIINIPETKCFSSGLNLGLQGCISFHRAKLHSSELHCTFLIYAAPSWALLHPNELHCTLLSYAATY